MPCRSARPILWVALAVAFAPGRAPAQLSLADDIIIAQGGGGEGKKKGLEKGGAETTLGLAPGSNAGPFRRVPGSSAVLVGRGAEGVDVVPGSIVRPGSASPLNSPSRGSEEPGRGLFQTAERRPIVPTSRLAEARSGEIPFGDPGLSTREDEGPPGGLTLDQALDLLIRGNQDLQTKFYEIPLAQADILTAGLRDNPLFFYDSSGVPYGSYSERRPGEIDHGISLVYPLDIGGKRRARQDVATQARRVIEAQFQDAVRLQIDILYEDFVAALAARDAVGAARDSLRSFDRQLEQAKDRVLFGRGDPEELEDLRIERETAAMLLDDERARLVKASRELAALLNLPCGQSDQLALRGSLAVPEPPAPPLEALIDLALRCRPDLVAYRLGIGRAQADVRLARADRIPDPYLLYTPWSFRDNSQVGLNSVSSWGAGVFVSIPLFNRNQGNIQRARLNVAQSRTELARREREVVEEVRQALADYRDTRADLDRLRRDLLPALRRKRERARRKFEAGEIEAATTSPPCATTAR